MEAMDAIGSTPNIDRIASEGMSVMDHYARRAVSVPEAKEENGRDPSRPIPNV